MLFVMRKRKNPIAIRAVLYLIFGLSILMPVIFLIYILPSYYRNLMEQEQIENTEMTLVPVSERVLSCLSEINEISTLAYSNQKLVNILLEKGSNTSIDLSEIDDYIDLVKVLQNDITSIIIEVENSNIYYYHRNQNLTLDSSYDFNKYFLNADTSNQYIGAHVQDYFLNRNDNSKVISMVKEIKHPYLNKSLGNIMIDADSALFSSAFTSINIKSTNTVLIDNEGEVLYSKHPVTVSQKEKIDLRESSMTLDGIENKIIYKQVPLDNWTICVFISMENINKKISLIYLVGIIAAIATIIVTYFILSYISSIFLLKPLKEMAKTMQEVEKGNLDVRFDYRHESEITALGKNLNQMIQKLQDLINKEYKMAISQKQAEYKALQARIKPHFLYNTLNCIIGLNRIGNKEKLEEAIFDLTEMMRYSLSNNSNGMTTIKQEIEFIKQYIHLETLRFEEKLDFQLNLDDRTLTTVIPKLLIQPLVENSIIHNVECSIKPVKVILSTFFSINDEGVYIIVEDEGKGFEKEKEKMGTGIKNVIERLKYGIPNSSIEIESVINKGTGISIFIPRGNKK